MSDKSIAEAELTRDLVGRLREDGVGLEEAEVVAQRFVDNLKSDHPDWFQPEVIPLEKFVMDRLAGAGVGLHPLRQVVENYLAAKNDYLASPIVLGYQGGVYVGLFLAMRTIASLFSDHADFKRVQIIRDQWKSPAQIIRDQWKSPAQIIRDQWKSPE